MQCVCGVIRALQGLRQKLLQTESALREAQANIRAKGAGYGLVTPYYQMGGSRQTGGRGWHCEMFWGQSLPTP
jgi:hypothetical protein